jgi:hypothetical protein
MGKTLTTKEQSTMAKNEGTAAKPARKQGPLTVFVACKPGIQLEDIYGVTTDPMHVVNLMAEKQGQVALHKVQVIKAKKNGAAK